MQAKMVNNFTESYVFLHTSVRVWLSKCMEKAGKCMSVENDSSSKCSMIKKQTMEFHTLN